MSKHPFSTFPRGWFRIAASAELPPRGVLPLQCFGEPLVLWRDEQGHAHLLEAHCSHQGAHLGHGGQVHGTALKCPFHGWRHGPDGRCRSVPGAEQPPAHSPLRVWPVIEWHGSLLAFHGPRERPADPAPPPVPECIDPAWQRLVERTWSVPSHIEEVLENLVDAAHFPGLHKTPSLPQTEFHAEGLRARIASRLALDSLGGPVATTLSAEAYGPGLWVLRFTGIVPATVLTTATPLDHERVAFHLSFLGQGDSALGRAFADSVLLEVDQDLVIWEHKLWRKDPPLSSADGPIRAYRTWFEQFYD
ncbi:MAG: aromatic ring-hydroxylating oxygenase subunit alpha [Planctomycetota bacterium]